MKVLITGGSHTGSLARGLARMREAGSAPSDIDFTIVPLGGRLAGAGKFYELRGDQVRITKKNYRERISHLSCRETPFDAVGISSPFHSRGLWMRPDWRNFCLPPITTGKTPLSRALVQRCIREHNANVIGFLEALKSVGFATFAIEGPKPFRHNPEIRRAGAPLVRYIDSEYTRNTLEALRERGIPALLMPAHTYDAEGYCRPEYRHDNPDDRHHGNALLGEVMINEITRFVRSRKTEATANSSIQH